jgi:hypothetical protein
VQLVRRELLSRRAPRLAPLSAMIRAPQEAPFQGSPEAASCRVGALVAPCRATDRTRPTNHSPVWQGGPKSANLLGIWCPIWRFTMARTKPVSKRKHSRKALPVWGAAGMSLAMAGGASATGVAPAEKASSRHTLPVITLGEEELSDVSLSKFFVFDRESSAARLGEKYAQRCGGRGCRGCGGAGRCGGRCGGCAVGRCGRCGVGCGIGIGCAGCSCSCCLSWGACQFC